METIPQNEAVSTRSAPCRPAQPASRAGRSWMVWLQAQPGGSPDPARAGMDRSQQAVVIGRCLFVLPDDGEAYSWFRHGRRAALFYGYLLNRAAVQRRLGIPDEPAVNEAELLLAAYAAWGDAAAEKLDGSFAAVLWDGERETLLGIRDAVGMVPFFYAQTGAGLVLSSDAWTVMRHPGVSREINRVVVAERMLWRHLHVEETFFAQVRRLPGGRTLAVRGSHLTTTRYWDPLPPGKPVAWIDEEELRRFPEVMKETIGASMALGPSAISLSAGIDSVSVAAFAVELAAEHGWPRPHGLGIHFDDRTCDESAGQRGVAETLEMPLRLLSFAECQKGRSLLEAACELAPAYPSPPIGAWEPLYAHLVDAARGQGIQVLLTGTGGDEWLSVSPYVVADLLRSGDVAAVAQLYSTSLRSYPVHPGFLARYLLWECGIRELLREAVYCYQPTWMEQRRRRRRIKLPDWVAPDPELRRAIEERQRARTSEPPVGSAYLRQIRPMLNSPLLELELEGYQYRARGRGVSYFHPYWSRSVLEFLIRTPPRLLHLGGRSKGFVRNRIAERFPQLDIDRRKKLYATDFLRRVVVQPHWRPAWARWAPDTALARAGIIDAPRLERAMESKASQRHVGDVPMWLSTEAWLRGQQ